MSAARTLTRVVGIGQPAAGDDGVGRAVVRALRAARPPGAELLEVDDGATLLPLLATPRPLLLVDAVVGLPPGEIALLKERDLDAGSLTPLSSHGLGVAQALALARALHPADISPRVRLLGIGITPPRRRALGLSLSAADAVTRAARAVLALLEGED